MKRRPRDVSVQLFRPEPHGARFLMLRRIPERGGVWQGVSGAPLAGESDAKAAVREAREETGFEIGDSLLTLGVEYAHALPPEEADRWEQSTEPASPRSRWSPSARQSPMGSTPSSTQPSTTPSTGSVSSKPTPCDWPIEQDALAGRRLALRALAARIT